MKSKEDSQAFVIGVSPSIVLDFYTAIDVIFELIRSDDGL